MPITVRSATRADAPAIARVHLVSHREAYVEPGLVSGDLVEGWTLADRTIRWATNLAVAEGALAPADGLPRMAIHVAEVAGRVVGWASTSAGRDLEPPRGIELEGLYALAEVHGTGVGQALLDAAIGDRPAYLWALETNPRAHAFYRRNGFELDGLKKPGGRWPVALVRLVR
ncbi:GNAT family N-acetyltransferase [Demequina gelatinilytica]|uniref:GNAT family N-acetyltransferase n=1 Tax=Demequina gelatinilytica TaxID=1638980 RepID=UPI0007858836|nr:GNAT family N-acetyltransferase [Demequina gelatinilytica]